MARHEVVLSDAHEKIVEAVSLEINRSINEILTNALCAFVNGLPRMPESEADANAILSALTLGEKIAVAAEIRKSKVVSTATI